MEGKEESVLEKLPSPISIPHNYTPDQIVLFQRRYENGYDIFTDGDYIKWLREIHPDVLLENLRESGEESYLHYKSAVARQLFMMTCKLLL